MTHKIKISQTGQVIAQGEEGQTVRAFEGNLYFAPETVEMQYLRVTERIYTCPYKGVCYWIDLDAPGAKAQNVGWVYRNPKPGYEFIKDQIGFYKRPSGPLVAAQE